MAAAHFLHDVFTAFPAPLLPLIIEKLDLSLMQAGSLVVILQIPSFFNPLLGSLADRSGFHRLLVILAPGVTGTLICCIGLAPSYSSLAILLFTAGISLAAIHIGGPVLVGRLAGDRVGRGMGFFMVGGELARTAGPLIAVQAVSSLGLAGIWRIAPVAVASSLVLWWRLSKVPVARPERKPEKLMVVWRGMSRMFIAITGILMARSFMTGAVTTFLVTYLHGQTGDLWTANISLSVVELGGAVGALVSGNLSDRVGRRKVLLFLIALAPPLLFLFILSGGWVRYLVLAPLGFATLSTTPVMLAMTVENAGSNQAAATGTFMMIAFAARSLILLVVGAMGDAFGLHTTYLCCAGMALIGLPFVLMLPAGGRQAA